MTVFPTGRCGGCGQTVTADHGSPERMNRTPGFGHTVPDNCSDCGGSGVIGHISPEMAADGGVPEAEGRPFGCSTCDGAGQIAASCGPVVAS